MYEFSGDLYLLRVLFRVSFVGFHLGILSDFLSGLISSVM